MKLAINSLLLKVKSENGLFHFILYEMGPRAYSTKMGKKA